MSQQQMPTSEVLNLAADIIQEHGWGQGPYSMMGEAGVCVMGAINRAISGTFNDNYLAVVECDAGAAVSQYLTDSEYFRSRRRPPLDMNDLMWQWNDDLPKETGATEVIAVLRAAAVLAAAREQQPAEVAR